MSAGIWQRLEEVFERALHHHDVVLRREVAKMGFNHLKACIIAGNAKIDELEAEKSDLSAKNADLEAKLTAAQATPAAPTGTSDSDLETLASSIEDKLGTKIPDPDAPTPPVDPNDPANHVITPTVGDTSTTAVNETAGTTTMLDHTTGTATTVDTASGVAAATDPTAVAAATQAATDAGVTIPPPSPT